MRLRCKHCSKSFLHDKRKLWYPKQDKKRNAEDYYTWHRCGADILFSNSQQTETDSSYKKTIKNTMLAIAVCKPQKLEAIELFNYGNIIQDVIRK